MSDAAHCLLAADPRKLAGEALGLAALCMTILAVLCLPALS
jgi:hypothetical protein